MAVHTQPPGGAIASEQLTESVTRPGQPHSKCDHYILFTLMQRYLRIDGRLPSLCNPCQLE